MRLSTCLWKSAEREAKGYSSAVDPVISLSQGKKWRAAIRFRTWIAFRYKLYGLADIVFTVVVKSLAREKRRQKTNLSIRELFWY